MPDRAGNFHTVEMFGPVDISAWTASYNGFFSAAIILKLVSKAPLANYAKKVARLHSMYGAQVWHVLYQADVRMRSEHMENLFYELSEKHAAAVIAGTPSDFDTDMPWDAVWKAAIGDRDFWEEEFTIDAGLVVNRHKSLSSVVKATHLLEMDPTSQHHQQILRQMP